MADEGSDVTTGNGPFDGRVDKVGEEGYAAFKKGVGDVHNTGGELDDGYLGVLLHFADGVDEAIAGDTGVRIDDEDVVANADVAW